MQNFTEKEQDLITSFVGNHGGEINTCIRENKCSAEDYEKINSLEAIFRKCSPILKTTLYRSDAICEPEFYLKWYSNNIGTVISRPEYLRTSKEKINGFNLIINTSQNTKSRDIEPVIAIREPKKARDESEVIFQRNTNFKIIAVDTDEIIIYMEETDAAADIVLTAEVIYNNPVIQAMVEARQNK